MSLVLYVGDRNFSSWSMRAIIALREMGVNFKEVLIPLDWPVKYENGNILGIPEYNIPPEPASGCGCEPSHIERYDSTGLIGKSYSKLVPRVPILVDENSGAVISDSLAIAEYIEEYNLGRNKIFGSSIKDRAEIKSFCYHIHGDYLPLMSGMSYSKSFYVSDADMPSVEAICQIDNLCRVIEGLLTQSGSPRFFLFGAFSLADVMLAPIAQSVRGWGYKVPQTVELYFEMLLSRNSVAKYIKEAWEPYERIRRYEHGSPAWVAAHYRYSKELSLIHNWRTDIYHKLENASAVDFFEEAVKGKGVSEIALDVATKFSVDMNLVLSDVLSFFDCISPEKDSTHGKNSFIY